MRVCCLSAMLIGAHIFKIEIERTNSASKDEAYEIWKANLFKRFDWSMSLMVSASLKYFKIITKRTINNKHARTQASTHTHKTLPADWYLFSTNSASHLISEQASVWCQPSVHRIRIESRRWCVSPCFVHCSAAHTHTHTPGIFHFNHIFKLGLRMNACDCGGVDHVSSLGKHSNTLYRVNNCCQIIFMNMDPLYYYPQ